MRSNSKVKFVNKYDLPPLFGPLSKLDSLAELALPQLSRPMEQAACSPVDFHLPFNDLQPTALLIPIEGQHAGHGYVFRGKNGIWLGGQMIMSDPQPLLDALSTKD